MPITARALLNELDPRHDLDRVRFGRYDIRTPANLKELKNRTWQNARATFSGLGWYILNLPKHWIRGALVGGLVGGTAGHLLGYPVAESAQAGAIAGARLDNLQYVIRTVYSTGVL